jgi:hypothetical protein
MKRVTITRDFDTLGIKRIKTQKPFLYATALQLGS